MAKSLVGAGLALSLVLGAAACSGAGSATPERSPVASGASASVLASARAGGASTEQLAILAKGAVPSFEDYEAALGRTVACMNAAGIDVIPMEPREQNGITLLGYGTPISSPGRTDAETAKVANACYLEHSRWVEAAWQMQPAALEAEEKRLADSRPGLIACLERNGIDVDESLSTSDILVIADDLARKTGAVDPSKQVACAVESGYIQVK